MDGHVLERREPVYLIEGCEGFLTDLVPRHLATHPRIRPVQSFNAFTPKPGQLLVVDLVNGKFQCDEIVERMSGIETWLVTSQSHVHPSWLGYAMTRKVRLLSDERGPGSWQKRFAVGIAAHLEDVGGAVLASAILASEPKLRPLSAEVGTICLHPWAIRRPADLARMCQTTIGRLRKHCEELGLPRVEHFITCVRLLGIAHLLKTGATVSEARRKTGVLDRRNFKRQMARVSGDLLRRWDSARV